MKWKDYKSITKEQLYWLVEFGIPKRRLTALELRRDKYKQVDSPVFFLSTGRTGTKWFAYLLTSDKALKVFHEPLPDLAVQSRIIHQYRDKLLDHGSIENQLATEIFIAGREQYLRHSVKSGKRFVETNNHMTFFAPMIARIIPNAKFVHLFRHPGEVVRSGLRRKWYDPGNTSIMRLIEPASGIHYENWSEYSDFQKICWLWNETNRFILEFSEQIEPDRFFSFNFNQLDEVSLNNLFNFIGSDITFKSIQKKLNEKVNVQTTGEVKEYGQWNVEDKIILKEMCGELANEFGYAL